MKRVLLLNQTYEALGLISEKKACKLLYKDKVDVLNFWEDDVHIKINNKKINIPATIILKYLVKKNTTRFTINFSRRAVFERDNYDCCYCGKKLNKNQATIDHVIPKSKNGPTTFTNCVTSCKVCNLFKSNKTCLSS